MYISSKIEINKYITRQFFFFFLSNEKIVTTSHVRAASNFAEETGLVTTALVAGCIITVSRGIILLKCRDKERH